MYAIRSYYEIISVLFPLTPITYDGGRTLADNGPGMNPMLTSTHSYQVDGGSPESGYSYSWGLYEPDPNDNSLPGAAVDPALYTITYVNDASITIRYNEDPNGTEDPFVVKIV